MRARLVQVGLAVGLIASAPIALAQKMNRCPDGKGGTIFQQEACGETADQAEARNKERARIEAETQRKKDEEARKKDESVQKARERDKVYQEQLRERAEEQRRVREAEQRLMEGTSKQAAVDDGTLPPAFVQSHPGAWKDVPDTEITAALAKNKIPGCPQYRYRQRTGGLPEFVVQCTTDKANWVTYFVWPKSEAVKGPAKF
jgi:hypothetical protein